MKPGFRKNGTKLNLYKVLLNASPFFVCAITFIIVRYGINNPGFIEKYYSSGIYPTIAETISFFSNKIPYSIWDIFWIVLFLFVIAGLIMVFIRKLSFSKYLLRFMQMIACLYSFFYLFWGLNYFRPSMDDRLGWQKLSMDEHNFRIVLDSLIDCVNRNYVQTRYEDYPAIEEKLGQSYSAWSSQLGFKYQDGKIKSKTILVSSLFAKSGISGYFGPLFSEVHVNYYQLPVDYAFTLAHEKAHQFGFANEAEANMAAFIVCTGSSDKRIRYSGYLHSLMYFLEDAKQLIDYHSYIEKIDPKVLDELRFRKSYYSRLRNIKIQKMHKNANNVYLKAQNIESGIKNYNQVVTLLITWYVYSGQILPDKTEIMAVK